MKRLQEETMCKMAVLGRGSMKDKQKVGDKKGILYSLFTLGKDFDTYIFILIFFLWIF